MKRLLTKIKTYISPFLNWRILIIYLPIWFIMSGWTYLFIFLGTRYKITWMLTAGTFWATILWLPITPEKLLTIPLTLYIYIRWRNKEDTVSNELQNMLAEARKDWQRTKTHLVALYRKTKTHLVAIYRKTKTRIVALYRKTKTWFNKNHGKIIKTLIIILTTLLVTMGLLLI